MKRPTARPLRTLLALSLDQTEVVATDAYSIAGVYGFGRGLFERSEIAGSETSYKKLNRLHEGQLVVSRLKAFEGALAVVPQQLDGWFLSPEFPTFKCIEGELDPGYLAHICRWSDFWSILASNSKGIGARRERVHVEDLLQIQLRVPAIGEQRRQADYLDAVASWADMAAKPIGRQDADSLVALLPGLVDTLIEQDATGASAVSELADFVSDTVHPGEGPAPATSFVGLQHIESHTGRRKGSDPLGTMKGRKFRFRPGDVIYGYLRPYLNKVWVADRDGLCSVDQYVLRPHPGVDSDLIAHCLRGRKVLNRAIDLTHSLQLPRLRSGLLASLVVPVVPPDRVPSLVSRLNMMQQRAVEVAAKRTHQQELVSALLPSALNRVFANLS